MGSRTAQSTNVPLPYPTYPAAFTEPTGPLDERFVYGLTPKGREALAALQVRQAVGEPGELPEPDERPVTEAEIRRRQRQRQARRTRAAGRRLATICGRFRGESMTRVPDLRLSGHWLRKAGFDLGQFIEVEVSDGRLVIEAV